MGGSAIGVHVPFHDHFAISIKAFGKVALITVVYILFIFALKFGGPVFGSQIMSPLELEE